MKIYKELLNINEAGRDCVLITVIDKKGSGPARIGFKMILTEDGKTIGTVGGGNLEYLAIQNGMDVFKEKNNKVQEYYLGESEEVIDIQKFKNAEKTGMICGGSISLYYEYHGVSDTVYLFGAGHVGRAILYHLEKLNYNIILIDSREDILKKVSDQITDKIISYKDINSLKKNREIRKDSFFIIATHSHDIDYSILKALIKEDCKPKYIGMIASKKKSVTIMNDIKKDFENNADIDKIRSPIGLNIGGNTADEIAISIISELQMVKYNKEDLKWK